MLIIGLTGSVASGKNFIAQIFKNLGATIFDSDFEVSKILDNEQKIINNIAQYFPKAVIKNKINRQILGSLVFSNSNNLKVLESIIHPILKEKRQKFIELAYRQKKHLVVLNIPLLFEKKIYLECDFNILVVANKNIKQHRFVQRELTKQNSKKDLLVEKFDKILQNQMPDLEKKKLADFIINNSHGKYQSYWQTKKIFNQIIK